MRRKGYERTGAGSAAKRAVADLCAHGSPRTHKSVLAQGCITSISTEKKYRYSIAGFIRCLRVERDKRSIFEADESDALYYLENRAMTVRQKQLDVDTAAIRLVCGLTLPRQFSQVEEALEPRAMTEDQFEYLVSLANADLALSLRIVWEGGLRAHELLSLREPKDQPETKDRPWAANRFAGLPYPHSLFTVIGKGRLTRLVPLSTVTAGQLFDHRERIRVKDREIYYSPDFKLVGGQSLSARFTYLSVKAFGWSVGIHGLRHAYAQRRIRELEDIGFSQDQAKQIVACELGHFRTDVTQTYLR